MLTKIEELTERMVSTADAAATKLLAELERVKAVDPKLTTLPRGFTNPKGELGPDGQPHRAAAMKYVLRPRIFIERFYRFLAFFQGLKSVYELGVGPGYMMVMLREMMDIEMRGCDIEIDRQVVFTELRDAFGITPLVDEFRVMSGEPIPIPPGTEGLTAFYTVFNNRWDVPDHEWFLEECSRKLSGPKRLILTFNPQGFSDRDDIMAFYRARARFPLADDGNFCILEV